MNVEEMIALLSRLAAQEHRSPAPGYIERAMNIGFIAAKLRAADKTYSKLKKFIQGSGSDSMPDDIRRDITFCIRNYELAGTEDKG